MTPKGKAKAAFQNLPVVGVFIDPVHMCRLSVPGDTTLDKIGQLLLNQIHKSLGEELPAPLNTQVLLGKVGLSTPFNLAFTSSFSRGRS
jgi:hypothetical protein